LTLVLYWASRSLVARQVVLAVASAIFYLSWIPVYFLLLVFALLVNWFLAARSRDGSRVALAAAVVFDIGVLALFKYSDFMLENLGLLFRGTPWGPLQLLLPLGISFYTFQAMAYVIDVYRRDIEHERKPLLFLLFILYFPQLIAGPICRAVELLPKLKQVQTFKLNQFAHGFFQFAGGLFLKIALADNLSPFVTRVFGDPSAADGTHAWLALLSFGVVIFCDFCGYSVMAVGASQMFGIEIPINFNLPYHACSLQDFWRRWHITLSTWIRDYMYIPMGGSRYGRFATCRNLLIVMALAGLWHGAAWTFVIWGVLHGGGVALERVWREKSARFRPESGVSHRLYLFVGWMMTMMIVFTAWTFFRAETVGQAWMILSRLTGPFNLELTSEVWFTLVFLGLFVLMNAPLHHFLMGQGRYRLRSTGYLISGFWLMIAGLTLGAGGTSEFIYFQF